MHSARNHDRVLGGDTKKGSGEDARDERVERPFMHTISGTSSLYGKVQAGLERGTARNREPRARLHVQYNRLSRGMILLGDVIGLAVRAADIGQR